MGKTLGIANMVGTKVFWCEADTAGTEGASYTELPGIEETSGGGIVNNEQTYTPHDTGVVSKVPTTQTYDAVRISVADTPVTHGAFGESVATILNDLARDRTIFDLVKMVPANNDEYKVIVWTGYLSNATTDDARAENLQRGEFTMNVSARQEFTGVITGGKPVLTARQTA